MTRCRTLREAGSEIAPAGRIGHPADAMGMHGEPPDLAAAAREQRALAVRLRDRRNWIMLAACLIGIGGAMVWIIFFEPARPGTIMGWAMLAFPVLGMLGIWMFARGKPRCPKCGHDWEIEDQEFPTAAARRTKCPGCGLGMAGK